MGDTVKQILHLVLASIVFACLTPFSVSAQRSGQQQPNGTIHVTVVNADGTPAPRGTLVMLEYADGGVAGSCLTPTGGRCEFDNLTLSMFILTLRQHGFQEAKTQVDLRDNLRSFATLVLKPEPGTGATAAPAVPKDAQGDTVSLADLGVPENARHEYEKGQEALKNEKTDEGIAHLNKAIKLYDNFPQAYTMLGTAYVQQQNWKDAQPALEKATQLDPKSPTAFFELGAVFNQTKNYPEAEKALNQGLTLNPDAAAGHYELAKAYLAEGKWQEAEPHAKKAVDGLPDLAAAHVLMGNILLRKSDGPGALHEFQEYLRLEPNGTMAASVKDVIAKIQAALDKK
jgi:Flp pilus assembly protein TadD